MITVTGSCRTGTSMMMQTLKYLGTPIIGYKFHEEFSCIKSNRKGYYDLPLSATINGINCDSYRGRAVKLFGYQLSKTDPKYISKVIICLRNKRDAITSTLKWLDSENVLEIDNTTENANKIFEANYKLISGYIRSSHLPCTVVFYENMINCPEDTIGQLKTFLQLNVSISKAVANIGV